MNNRWVSLAFQLIGVLIILFSILYAARYMVRFSVNVPNNDDWNYISQYQDFLSGKIDLFNILTRQDSGYRQPTLRLLWFPLLALTKVNVQAVLLSHIGIQIAVLSGAWLIYRSYVSKANVILFAPVALLLFSVGQSDGFLWAGTTPYFLANLGAVFAIALIDKPNKMYFALALGAAVFANYSYGNGFLVWPLTGLVLLACAASKKRWLMWFLAAIIFCGLYAINWQMLLAPAVFARSPSLAQVYARNPFDVYEFFFSILGMSLNGKHWFGSIFQFQSVAHPAIIGALMLILFVAVLIQLAACKAVRASILPIALFLFGVLNCALLTLGRVGDGEAGAFQTRYVISTTLSAVGLYLLVLSAAKNAGGLWRIAQWFCLIWIIWSVFTIKVPDADAYGKI